MTMLGPAVRAHREELRQPGAVIVHRPQARLGVGVVVGAAGRAVEDDPLAVRRQPRPPGIVLLVAGERSHARAGRAHRVDLVVDAVAVGVEQHPARRQPGCRPGPRGLTGRGSGCGGDADTDDDGGQRGRDPAKTDGRMVRAEHAPGLPMDRYTYPSRGWLVRLSYEPLVHQGYSTGETVSGQQRPLHR